MLMQYGADILASNADMDGKKHVVVMGWDKGKQDIAVKQVVPAGYTANSGQDGSWVGVGVSSHLSFRDIYGDPCGNAEVIYTLSNGVMYGQVYSVWGNTFTFGGTVNTNGLIEGTAQTPQGITDLWFNGSISSNVMSGKWSDIYGCYGTWVGFKN